MTDFYLALSLSERAEWLAQKAGLRDAAEAWKLLHEDKLNGTILEVELRMLKFLMESKQGE